MIYEHPETGLRVAVSVYEHVTVVRQADAVVHQPVVRREMRTDAQQPVAIVDAGDDDHRLIDVLTAKGSIRMVRQFS